MTESYWDSSSDPYVYPGTRILKNIPDIHDEAALVTFEQRATALRYDEAMISIKDAPLALSTWKKLHKTLFQDVYDWAGEIRHVQLAKGNTVFAIPEHIERQADELFAKMKIENLKDLDSSRRADRLAYYFAELNVLHPFREGNGRTQKMFFDEITRRFGSEIDWAHIDTQEFLDALVRAYHSQDYSKVATIFERTLRSVHSPL
jgi:cell filamentation protein